MTRMALTFSVLLLISGAALAQSEESDLDEAIRIASLDGPRTIGAPVFNLYPLSATPPPQTDAAGSSEGAGQDVGELAKTAQNPLGALISLPFQNNTSFGLGSYDRTQNVMNVQPVIPFDLGEWLLITRTIVPVVYQPDITEKSGGTWGIGDINSTLWFSPKSSTKPIWGIGPILSFPTASDDVLGTGKWSAGPSAVALVMTGPWVAGGLINNIWSFAGDSKRESVNQMLIQPFVNYNLDAGWYLVTSPIITANWRKDRSDRWLVPLGGGAGRTFKIGSQPINCSLQAYYNVVHPDNGPRWSLRIQIQFLFPK